MATPKTIVFGVILGCLLYAWYIAWFKPAEVSNLRNIVRQEFANHNLTIPARLRESAFEGASVNDLKIEHPDVNKFSFDPIEEHSIVHENNVIPATPVDGLMQSLISDAVKVESPTSKCQRLKITYGVVPGTSWGALTPDLQTEWNMLNCDKLSETPAIPSVEAAPSKVVSTSTTSASSSSSSGGSDGKRDKKHKKKHKGEEAGLHSVDDATKVWCTDTMAQYKVQPMKSWGNLPLNLQDTWKNRGCDIIFTNQRLSERPLSTCAGTGIGLKEAPSLPLVAIMAGSTTRKNPKPSVRTIPLFKFLLPSLIRSLDCGYRYEYVLGYDKGDAFYDSEEGMAEVRKWWKSNVEDPLSGNGIKISLRLVRVNNTLKKPGPVFNEMARSAYQAGADYFYRVNDDTELMVNWPDKFVKAVKSLGVPYGVVGPYCKAGNDQILTHDFVSRLHMEIFEMNYYPPELSDWWMDDWVSFVYGKSRSFKAKHVPVVHHSGKKSYEVDFSHEALLPKLLQSGRQKIRQWMLKNGASEEQLVAFDKDQTGKFVHNDIPSP